MAFRFLWRKGEKRFFDTGLAFGVSPDGTAVSALAAMQQAGWAHLRQKPLSCHAISYMATCQQKRQRPAEPAGQGADIGGAPAPGATNRQSAGA